MILLRLALPFVVWSSAFLALYAAHAAGCRFDWDARWPLLAVWLAHLAMLALLSLRSWRAPTGLDLPARLVHPLDLAALAATLWLGVPVLALHTCGP